LAARNGMGFDGYCHGGHRRGAVPNAMAMVVCDAAATMEAWLQVHDRICDGHGGARRCARFCGADSDDKAAWRWCAGG